jgi:cell division septum initiation protein DivIVA
MGDGFESVATDPRGDTRFAGMIRDSVRELVEGVLAQAPGGVDERQDIRAAGERLGQALAAHAGAGAGPDTARCPKASAAKAEIRSSADASDRRARAFRKMAGVRS